MIVEPGQAAGRPLHNLPRLLDFPADRYLREIAGHWDVRAMSNMERFDHLLGAVAVSPFPWKALAA
ncbi:MAG: hypothetical protein M0Z84_08895 [Gammaproteobacteria bacterium]|nr:hypothetical protein [Gammaproteobacteria bacterium]